MKKKKRKWKYKVDNKMRNMGICDYDKKEIKINKKASKKHGRVRPVNKHATKYPETLDTIVHEHLHKKHPKMHEKTVYKMARQKVKTMSTAQKKKFYSKFRV